MGDSTSDLQVQRPVAGSWSQAVSGVCRLEKHLCGIEAQQGQTQKSVLVSSCNKPRSHSDSTLKQALTSLPPVLQPFVLAFASREMTQYPQPAEQAKSNSELGTSSEKSNFQLLLKEILQVQKMFKNCSKVTTISRQCFLCWRP